MEPLGYSRALTGAWPTQRIPRQVIKAVNRHKSFTRVQGTDGVLRIALAEIEGCVTGHLSWTAIGHVQHRDWMDKLSLKRAVLSSGVVRASMPSLMDPMTCAQALMSCVHPCPRKFPSGHRNWCAQRLLPVVPYTATGLLARCRITLGRSSPRC